MSIPYELDKIKKTSIEELVKFSVREGETLDFKAGPPNTWRQIPSDKQDIIRDEKAEFLKDVSAFANAGGGDLVYGLGESEGAVAGEADGFDCSNLDGLKRHLQALCRENIDPPVELKLKAVEGFEKGIVLVVRVPDTWNKPHMVTIDHSTNFYKRQGTENSKMSIDMIRRTVLGSEELADEIREFRTQRIETIKNRRGPSPVDNHPFLALHVVPVQRFRAGDELDIPTVAEQNPLRSLSGYPGPGSFNIDGVVFVSGGRDQSPNCCVQLFRNGCIETIKGYRRDGDELRLPGIARRTLRAMSNYIKFYRDLKIAPPIVVMFSMIGFKGREIHQDPSRGFTNEQSIDRDMVLFPDRMIRDVNDDADIVDLLEPVLQLLWQACGYKEVWPGVLDDLREEV